MPAKEPSHSRTAYPSEITDAYEIGETLGTGHFSKVKRGTHRITGDEVAIKIIKKPRSSKMKMLEAEVNILTKCKHPHIVTLFQVVDTEDVLYLVMELLTGGELFDRIITKGHYSEEDARKLAFTMTRAIKYLHEQGIAHRDLKPENLLLSDNNDNAQVKITDFGLSKIYAPDGCAQEVTMKTACGTPGYVAPEVLSHENYSSQVDMWSFGVICYILLCGFPPFYGDNDHQMFKKIKQGNYRFIQPFWDPVSNDAKDFVSKLLTVDWRKRMTAEQALKHAWLKGLEAGELDAEPADRQGSQLQRQATYNMHEKFKDFNIGRKAGNIEEFRRLFDLPETEARFGLFKCSLNGDAGTLHVGSTRLCFNASAGDKKLNLGLAELSSVTKAKKLLGPKYIKVQCAQEKPLVFGNFVERKLAYELICTHAAECGNKLS